MNFDFSALIPELQRAVREQGYESPTSIQAQAIPVVLQGQDLLAGSQTGTGKTAAFTLPLLQRLASNRGKTGQGKPIRALILAPTRELAMQVDASIQTYGKHLPLRSTAVFGGVNIRGQIRILRSGVDIVVATPGRLLDLKEQGAVNFAQLEVLILDEADRMLDMGFIRDIRRILALLPKVRQNLMFSATFDSEIRDLAKSMMSAPVEIDVAPRNSGTHLITHVVHPVDRARKLALLTHLIRTRNLRQVLVFTRTKHMANSVSNRLAEDGITSLAIHGNKSQAHRVKALQSFKSGAIRILVATDIAARGLDIDQLPHVVNFELPFVPEDFVHRTGRTGRAGNEGEAISLVCVDEDKLLRDIERLMKKSLPVEVVEGFRPDPTIKAEPIVNGRQSGPRHPGPKHRGLHEQHRQSSGGQGQSQRKPSHQGFRGLGSGKKPQGRWGGT